MWASRCMWITSRRRRKRRMETKASFSLLCWWLRSTMMCSKKGHRTTSIRIHCYWWGWIIIFWLRTAPEYGCLIHILGKESLQKGGDFRALKQCWLHQWAKYTCTLHCFCSWYCWINFSRRQYIYWPLSTCPWGTVFPHSTRALLILRKHIFNRTGSNPILNILNEFLHDNII